MTQPPAEVLALSNPARPSLAACWKRLTSRGNHVIAAGAISGNSINLVTRYYTLTEGQRDRAVELGAQVITARTADKMERQQVAMRGEGQF